MLWGSSPVSQTPVFHGDCTSSRRFFLPGDQVSLASLGDFPPASFCELRHAAGGMPNWLMNHRVNELAIE
ncbi:hypothetical protein D3C86_2174290 [compost metagenome]